MSGFRRATSSSPIATPGPSFNVTPQNAPHLRQAAANVRAGLLAPGPIWLPGDSITDGEGSTSYALNYPTILTGLLNQLIPTAQTYALPHNPSGDLEDPRVTLGANWALTNSGTATFAWKNSSTTGSLSFAPCGQVNGPAKVDTVEIYNVIFGGFTGSFTVDIGGAVLATLPNGTGSGINTVALGAPAVSTINITPSGGNGNTWIYAIRAYDSTNPTLEIANAGIGGDQSNSLGRLLTTFAPAASLIMYGTNDAAAGVTPAQFIANEQAIIAAAQLSGDAILASFIPSGAGGITAANEALYVPQLALLAAADSLPYLDLYGRWVSYAVSNALGYMANVTHPTKVGYADIAAAFAEMLKVVL